ncbi:hypothetical protein F0562_034440 [Nyssa sinensis]|uniref:SNARE associated Golgi protein family n=1 Tax=Nyssa sinensis TaxID=561372 RepID=A0A5J5AJV6_9ASTE|nr:hypothetical protein F0562_034440 [Nyssa sinensis]
MGRSSRLGRWVAVGVVVGIIGVLRAVSKQYGWDKDAALQLFREMSDRLGIWAIPAYVGLHTLTLALCLPYAVFFEAGASLLFGFFPAVLCVFSAKVLGSSLSFWIGRLVFRRSSLAMEWAQRNRYFNLLSRGVERDEHVHWQPCWCCCSFSIWVSEVSVTESSPGADIRDCNNTVESTQTLSGGKGSKGL